MSPESEISRKKFISMGIALTGINGLINLKTMVEPEQLYFKDDGIIPNSKFPLLLYKNAFKERGDAGAEWLENHFLSNNWHNSWRNGIFTFQHYHSITHEVLGIYSGECLVLLGGEKGNKVTVKAGDIIVIPAGVGHKNLGDKDLGVVGAYPNGMPVDIIRGEPGDRPQTDKNIAAVPMPGTDPFMGKDGSLMKIWK